MIEHPCLLPLADQGFEIEETLFPVVNGNGCVRVKTNSYSSPLVKAWPLHVDIYEDLTCVATHTRCCNGPRYLPVIVRDSAPGIVALLSPYFIVSKRSSPSRVRFAAPAGAPLTAPGRFGSPS